MRMVRLLMAAVLGLLGLVIVAPSASAATQAVMIENYSYSPSTLTVKVGDTVTWTNHDQAPHDVTTTSAPVAIKSPTLSTGQSFTYTFTTAGSYSYYCSIHPDMRAQIVVQPAAVAPAPVATAPKTTTSRKPATTSRPAASTSQAAGQAPVSSMSMPPDPGAEAAAPASSVAPVETQPAVAAGVTPTSTTTLDPMLIVAGVAAGVAVLCLLILGSRRET